jgi:hypothetical protein
MFAVCWELRREARVEFGVPERRVVPTGRVVGVQDVEELAWATAQIIR